MVLEGSARGRGADHGGGRDFLRALVCRALLCAISAVAVGEARGQARVSVVPAVTVAEIYDDNVFFQPDGGFPEGAIVDEPEDDEDFITRITPSLAISGGWPRLSLFARADTGMEYYARNTDLNSSATSSRRGPFSPPTRATQGRRRRWS
jgi:hypothetical protein